jgi:UDP-glucose:(heptosyl)LPS alpha-1,3-glucosyltransferase
MIFKQRRYRKIIAISEMVKRDIIENYKVPADDIDIIYNPVDLEKFHPGHREKYRQEIRRQYGIEDREFVALFVGSGFERKGVGYLIEAAELLDAPVTVMIVGKGKGDKFRHIIRRQRVIFCGPQKHVERYYVAADAFVFPTIYEPFNVHLEALASGSRSSPQAIAARPRSFCTKEWFVVKEPRTERRSLKECEAPGRRTCALRWGPRPA